MSGGFNDCTKGTVAPREPPGILPQERPEHADHEAEIKALQEALDLYGRPEILNTGEVSQFATCDFFEILERTGIEALMDGKGR